MNFTVTSRGRQFDRLALMYLNDTEVWRTSTAEPTINGIEWTYLKDMSHYLSYWTQPQKLIFDLGNIIDSTYTGFFNCTLTATFFTSEDTVDAAPLIIPISARKSSSNSASLFTLPSDNATNTIDFPQNANRAVFTISACGQAAEEFWWSNVLQSDVDTFLAADGVLYGYSPFREVQLYIDGQLAGVEWPFPIIFTGGVVPGLWRPIVGIDAFDLREHEIDITPWLPILCDGSQHTFEIKVAGINDDGETSGTLTETVGSSWYVTGKIFIWLDEAGSITTGSTPVVLLPPPTIALSQSLTQSANGTNETLTYSTSVKRVLSISSAIKTQNGSSNAGWTQSLSYINVGQYTDQGNVQATNQTTNGLDQSTGTRYYKSIYEYPLFANTTYWVDPSGSGNYTIEADIVRGLMLEVDGQPVFPTGIQPFGSIPRSAALLPTFQGTLLDTTQTGSAYYLAVPSQSTSYSSGTTEQDFYFGGVSISDSSETDTELYKRHVKAVNATVIEDQETLVGVSIGDYSYPIDSVGTGMLSQGTAPVTVKAMLGRGPGDSDPKFGVAGGR